MRALIDRSDEKWAMLPNSNQQNTNLAIFVHGFIGEYLGTWGALPDLLKDNADSFPPFDEWDFLFVGYDTKDPLTFLDIARLICTHWEQAAAGALPLGRRYDKVALLGHSLGTLGIRQALCAWAIQPQGMRTALHSVTLFGTPLNGSPLAKFATWRYKIAEALKPGSAQLKMLRTWLKGAFKKEP